LRERPDDYGDDVRGYLELGELQLATHYIQAQRYRSILRAEFERALSDVCGLVDGLPVGMQVIRPAFGEGLVLRVADAYQAVTDWHRRTPSRQQGG
jgi:hypothetical protein